MRRAFDVVNEVAALGDLSRSDLAGLWQKAHGHLPPKGVKADLLMRSASWNLQAKRLGGISAETRRLLRAAISQVEDKSSACHHAGSIAGDISQSLASALPKRSKLTPGTQLLRDWNGTTHVVDVIDEGFVFQAKLYTSLTAIARKITGARWSGPRFFGL